MSAPPFDPRRRQALRAASLAPIALAAGAHAAGRPPGWVPPARSDHLRVAFGSCARQDKPQPVWRAIAQARPDLFVFLGDNLYADARDAATLRQRYAEFRAVAPLQAFRREVPHLAVWDDHDFGDDDVGGDYPLKALSQQLFCDEWGEPAGSPRRTRDGIYESWRLPVGDRVVQLILLDLRFNRTPLVTDPKLHQDYRAMVMRARLTGEAMPGWYVPNPDPQATMLGAPQWAWLERQLSEPADVRIIGSSVQFAADGTGWEGWANFPADRARLGSLLRKTRAEGVVMISGDMHYADISRFTPPGGYPLWDATSSGLTEVWNVPTPNRNRVSPVLAEVNFGLLDIAFGSGDGELAFTICDVDGQPRLRQSLALGQLRFASKD